MSPTYSYAESLDPQNLSFRVYPRASWKSYGPRATQKLMPRGSFSTSGSPKIEMSISSSVGFRSAYSCDATQLYPEETANTTGFLPNPRNAPLHSLTSQTLPPQPASPKLGTLQGLRPRSPQDPPTAKRLAMHGDREHLPAQLPLLPPAQVATTPSEFGFLEWV